jgi:hypothetical protein
VVNAPVAPVSLVRFAQWATLVLGDPGFSLSTASADELEAFVQRAEATAPTRPGWRRTRRLDLFPTTDPAKDTVVAQTMRWLIDCDRPMPVKTYMDVYHAYSKRALKPDARGRMVRSRSSFVNNIGGYTRGPAAVLDSYEGEVILRKNGQPRLKTIRHWRDHWVAEKVQVRRQMVKWIGPSVDTWLRTMLDRDLDKALALMEKRLLQFHDQDDLGALVDDAALAKRWFDRISTEIERRMS